MLLLTVSDQTFCKGKTIALQVDREANCKNVRKKAKRQVSTGRSVKDNKTGFTIHMRQTDHFAKCEERTWWSD